MSDPITIQELIDRAKAREITDKDIEALNERIQSYAALQEGKPAMTTSLGAFG